MKKDKIIINMQDPFIIDVNGKKYRMKRIKGKRIDGILHGDKMILTPFNEEEYNSRISFIIERLEDSFKKEEILKEVLRLKTEEELEKIEKLLKEGAKVSKHSGCLGLKIGGKGGAYIDIVG